MTCAQWLVKYKLALLESGIDFETIDPLLVYRSEQLGLVVDLATGQACGRETDSFSLTATGDALAIIQSTGFLDE